VIFWHTGGTPALFSYAETLTGNLEETLTIWPQQNSRAP